MVGEDCSRGAVGSFRGEVGEGEVRSGEFACHRAGEFEGELVGLGGAGVAIADLRPLVTALGYRAIIEGEQEFFIGRPRRRGLPEKIRRRASPRDGHPFAKLKELNFA